MTCSIAGSVLVFAVTGIFVLYCMFLQAIKYKIYVFFFLIFPELEKVQSVR